MEGKYFVYKNTTHYLKNRCSKRRLIGIHFHAFLTLISNMVTVLTLQKVKKIEMIVKETKNYNNRKMVALVLLCTVCTLD